MKPFIIIKVDTTLHDMAPPREAGRALVYANLLSESKRPHDFTGDHPVYFADTEADADTLSSYLASKVPGTTWVVAKSASTFRCAPGPVAKASFTDRGLMPAN